MTAAKCHIYKMSKLFKAHKPKPAQGAKPPTATKAPETAAAKTKPGDPTTWPKEVGGPEGPEPTRYGDWERKGICSDF